MIQLPGSSMLPEAANALDKLSTTKKHHKSSPTLGQTEDQRLRDAAKRLSAKSLGSKLKSSPYQTTNVSLRRTRRKQKSSKLHYNAQMRSKLLEQYFLINRNEQEVSFFLQISILSFSACDIVLLLSFLEYDLGCNLLAVLLEKDNCDKILTSLER